MERMWGGGRGGQCRNKRVAGDDFCKTHARGNGPPHGRVDGPTPGHKPKEFRAFRLSHPLATREFAAAVAPAQDADSTWFS